MGLRSGGLNSRVIDIVAQPTGSEKPGPGQVGPICPGWQKRCARGTLNFEQFERALHALVLSVERECVEARLARCGLDVGEYKTFELSSLSLADTKGCGVARDGLSRRHSRDAFETLSVYS